MSNEKLPERSCQTRAPETIIRETRDEVRHSCRARRSDEELKQIQYRKDRCIIRVAGVGKTREVKY